MTVTYIFRKKNPVFFSIERVFADIMKELTGEVSVQEIIAPAHGVSPGNLRMIRQEIRQHPADIYHITGDIHYATMVLPGRRTLLTIHDCVFLYQKKGWQRLVLKKLLLDWPVRKSALVTTISEASRQDILKYTGCPPEKVVVIPNPVNDLIRHEPRAFNKECPVILFIGSTPNKNLPRVIPALENIPCKLHIVGEIPPSEVEVLARHGINYTQESRISDAELANRYAMSDMVLFPSTFEGFGLPIVEAQKSGRPVVTSDLSPMKEVAAGAACLVDPFSVASIREGIIRVIADDAFRNKLVADGLLATERIDRRSIAHRYAECYRTLIAKIQ